MRHEGAKDFFMENQCLNLPSMCMCKKADREEFNVQNVHVPINLELEGNGHDDNEMKEEEHHMTDEDDQKKQVMMIEEQKIKNSQCKHRESCHVQKSIRTVCIAHRSRTKPAWNEP